VALPNWTICASKKRRTDSELGSRRLSRKLRMKRKVGAIMRPLEMAAHRFLLLLPFRQYRSQYKLRLSLFRSMMALERIILVRLVAVRRLVRVTGSVRGETVAVINGEPRASMLR
jgi:hypothetical protein